MGRKSKLTDEQIHEAVKRTIDGEPIRAIAREYGIAESSLRERISAQVSGIKDAANQIVSAEQKLSALPIAAQITAQNLAAKLRAISDNLLSAATYGAMTAHRLHGMAHEQLDKIDSADLESSEEHLKAVAQLTRVANESSSLAVNLINANKDAAAKAADEEREKPKSLNEFYGELAKPKSGS